jgi:hypothetical protein
MLRFLHGLFITYINPILLGGCCMYCRILCTASRWNCPWPRVGDLVLVNRYNLRVSAQAHNPLCPRKGPQRVEARTRVRGRLRLRSHHMTVAIFLFRNIYTVGVAPGGDLQNLVV